MKYFLVFFTFILTIFEIHALDQEFVEKFMEKMQQIAEECVDETGATEDDLAELIAKKIPPSTHEAKCMIFCLNKKLKIQTESGEVDKVAALLALDDLKAADLELFKKILKIFIDCESEVKMDPDPCESATNMAICFKREANAAGLENSLFV
nr:odorant-binding protein 4 [Lytta caraganae]